LWRGFLLAVLSLSISTATFAYGNDFSCSYGKQGACLDYGDKVCSSLAKCVSQDAVCFDSSACDYKGFICKSKFDGLVDRYNDLSSKYSTLATKYDDLVDEHNDLVRRFNNLQSCVGAASSLDEARACSN